jgi:hypothetical protein
MASAPTLSKTRGRNLSRVESFQDLRMRMSRDICHKSSLDEPATSRVDSKIKKRVHSKCDHSTVLGVAFADKLPLTGWSDLMEGPSIILYGTKHCAADDR